MTATKYVKLRGDHSHPELLANGQTVVPGEPFERSALATKAKEGEPTDARLIDEGLIIDSDAPKEA